MFHEIGNQGNRGHPWIVKVGQRTVLFMYKFNRIIIKTINITLIQAHGWEAYLVQ